MFNHVGNSLSELPNPTTVNGVRYYCTPSGKKLPSITSITSLKSRKSIAEWRKRVGDVEADRLSKQGTTRGTKYHAYAEDYFNNLEVKPKDLMEQISKPYQLFENSLPYFDDINNIHALEAPLYSEYYGLAGRVDCIAEYQGELAIVDFKTSRKQKPEKWIEHYFVQCAAYGALYHDLTGIEVQKVVIIQACEDGEVQLFQKYDIMYYMKLLEQYIDEFVNYHKGEKFTNV